MSIQRYVAIDEEGYFTFDGRRVEDQEAGKLLIRSMKPSEGHRLTTEVEGQIAFVEAFDAPLIARHVQINSKDPSLLELDFAYQTRELSSLNSLSLDEWDRFHGLTERQIPFVMSRQAQVEFFDLMEAFDDDSITIQGRRYPIHPWLGPAANVQSADFWTNIYRTETPGWELGRESSVLPNVLPQLKLGKCRVLVLGCGSGHDAAYFASQGHVVTGVDFSEEAIQRAKANYGDRENLKFVQADAFALPKEWNGRFDLIFEHTCYCAISPDRRTELTKQWKRLLHDQGHLLGVFFVMEKREGPPFGGSEWEVRERLRKAGFHVLFWTRWHHSIEGRRSKELVVYAKT